MIGHWLVIYFSGPLSSSSTIMYVRLGILFFSISPTTAIRSTVLGDLFPDGFFLRVSMPLCIYIFPTCAMSKVRESAFLPGRLHRINITAH